MATPEDGHVSPGSGANERSAWRAPVARTIERQVTDKPQTPRTSSWRDYLSLSFRIPA